MLTQSVVETFYIICVIVTIIAFAASLEDVEIGTAIVALLIANVLIRILFEAIVVRFDMHQRLVAIEELLKQDVDLQRSLVKTLEQREQNATSKEHQPD